MFEKIRDYPTAYIHDEDDESLIRAIQWVLHQAKSRGGTPLLYAPGKQNISYREPISAFAKRYPVMTPRTRGVSTGAAARSWPCGPTTRCSVRSATTPAPLRSAPSSGGISPLRVAATGAVNLDPAASGTTTSLPPIDPVVRQGLMQLGHAVNPANIEAR